MLDLSRPVTTFRPDRAFGAAFDGVGKDESRPLLDPANRAALRDVSPPRGTYRIRTELAIEAWHWSAYGAWSDPAHAQGYWTGDAARDDDAPLSWGYRLPRRGDTLDEANDDGFSRLTDGDPASFWKSNPYLNGRYTGLPGERAEWVKVDLGHAAPVDAVEIAWSDPYAVSFTVQRWDGPDESNGRWADFPGGRVVDGRGGVQTVRLGAAPPARYLRLLLTASSHTAAAGATDARDRLGYAAAELRIGRIGPDGRLQDEVRHAPDKTQSLVYVSSTDPWHRAVDRDPQVEQPSPLRLVADGFVGRGPMMLPVGVLYDTPENALAEVGYFRRRGLPFHEVELGEEPDGQRIRPADYAALYAPLSREIRARWPDLVTGGPSLVDGLAELWMEDPQDPSWTAGFVQALKTGGALDRLGFFSFEFYPFEEFCTPGSAKLQAEPGLLGKRFDHLRRDGVPAGTPMVISEYGLSAYSARMDMELTNGLFTAQTPVEALYRGGTTSYLYGFPPDRPLPAEKPCAGRGNMMLWLADDHDHARWALPSFHGWRMLTAEWSRPGDGEHALFPAASVGAVTAYPVRRPDGSLAVMLLNRGDAPAAVRLGGPGLPRGAPEALTYGPGQYAWSARGGRPVRDLPPVRSRLSRWTAPVTLPPLGMAVVRGS